MVIFFSRERGIASSQSSGQQVLIKKRSIWPEGPEACAVPGSKSVLCLLTSPEQSQAHRCRQLRGCTTLEAKAKTSKNSKLELCASKSYLCKGFFVSPSLCWEHRALTSKEGCCWEFDWLLTAVYFYHPSGKIGSWKQRVGSPMTQFSKVKCISQHLSIVFFSHLNYP